MLIAKSLLKISERLYVFDEEIINARLNEIENDFIKRHENVFACYAGKAFLIKHMAEIIKNHNLGLDVVSQGELLTALRANFPADKIEMHGNAKSSDEILLGVKSGVGRFIVDNPDELELLAKISRENNFVANILLRVSPAVDAHTHAHIATGAKNSKFGFPIESEMLINAVKFSMNDANINLTGLHFHVGSQLFEPNDHIQALEKIIKLILKLKRELNFTTRELNFGGGLGAVKNPTLKSVALKTFTDPLIEILDRECRVHNLLRPRAIIEPGRWIISEAGITLYTVENVKYLPEIIYVAVNGGMADNPRYALYGAEYDAVNINNPDGEIMSEKLKNIPVSIVGRCCESGDILIERANISDTKRGDVIALFNTGAYTFSMAGNYNKLLRPAVVFVKNGQANLKVERQSYEDLLKGEL